MRGKEIEEMNFKKAAKPGLHSALCILTSLSPTAEFLTIKGSCAANHLKLSRMISSTLHEVILVH